MKIREGFSLKNIDGENIICCTNPEFNTTITLSETATFLWHKLEGGAKTKEQLMNLLLDAYDISTVLALNDIDMFVKILEQNGIVE